MTDTNEQFGTPSGDLLEYCGARIPLAFDLASFAEQCRQTAAGAIVLPILDCSLLFQRLAQTLDEHLSIGFTDRDHAASVFGVAMYCRDCLRELTPDYPSTFWFQVGVPEMVRGEHRCPVCGCGEACYVYLYRWDFGPEIEEAIRRYWRFRAETFSFSSGNTPALQCSSCGQVSISGERYVLGERGKLLCSACLEASLKSWRESYKLPSFFGDGELWRALAYARMIGQPVELKLSMPSEPGSGAKTKHLAPSFLPQTEIQGVEAAEDDLSASLELPAPIPNPVQSAAPPRASQTASPANISPSADSAISQPKTHMVRPVSLPPYMPTSPASTTSTQASHNQAPSTGTPARRYRGRDKEIGVFLAFVFMAVILISMFPGATGVAPGTIPVLSAIGAVISIALVVIGLSKPPVVIFWGSDKSRPKAFGTYGLVAALFISLSIITLPVPGYPVPGFINMGFGFFVLTFLTFLILIIVPGFGGPGAHWKIRLYGFVLLCCGVLLFFSAVYLENPGVLSAGLGGFGSQTGVPAKATPVRAAGANQTQRQPAPTLAPTSMPIQRLRVANTDGQGAWIRRTPNLDDRLKVWPEGTEMIAITQSQNIGGKLWQYVKDPDGNMGWIPAEYLTAITLNAATTTLNPQDAARVAAGLPPLATATAQGAKSSATSAGISTMVGTPGKVLFHDEFESADITQAQWSQGAKGNWHVENGYYVGSVKESGQVAMSVAGDKSWQNYQFSVDLKGLEGVDKIVYFNYSDDENTYAVNLRSASYNDLVLTKGVGGHMTAILKSASVPNQKGQWYALKIVIQGKDIRIAVDGKEYINYTAQTQGQGQIVLAAYYGGSGTNTVCFDNVKVTALNP